MIVHVNEIKLYGDSKWHDQFNLCSDLYIKSKDESLTSEERESYLDRWWEERYRLESGNY